MFTSPLEQFQVFPIIPIYFGPFDFSITNVTIVLGLVLSFFVVICLSLASNKYLIIPGIWQYFLEKFYCFILGLVKDTIKGDTYEAYFPLIFSIFLCIASLNLVGMVPFCFTVTSSAAVVLYFTLVLLIAFTINSARMHGIKFFTLFVPAGVDLKLAFLLLPIEILSYVFRPISLAVRLFSNMVAGHTLLKVVSSFAFILMGTSGVLFLLHYIPFLLLIPLIGLEIVVALIQSYVFSVMLCIYINDAVNLH